MKIEKEVDALGRVVIPKNIRDKFGIGARSKVVFSVLNDSILISTKSELCVLCKKEITAEQKSRLCNECIRKIKEQY